MPRSSQKRHSFFGRSDSRIRVSSRAGPLSQPDTLPDDPPDPSTVKAPRSPSPNPPARPNISLRIMTRPWENLRSSIFTSRKRSADPTGRSFSVLSYRAYEDRTTGQLPEGSEPVFSREHFHCDDEYHLYLKKTSISPPFNFHHLTHTTRKQVSSLAEMTGEEVAAEFNAISAPHSPRRVLTGIAAHDIADRSSDLPFDQRCQSPTSRQSYQSPTPQQPPRPSTSQQSCQTPTSPQPCEPVELPADPIELPAETTASVSLNPVPNPAANDQVDAHASVTPDQQRGNSLADQSATLPPYTPHSDMDDDPSQRTMNRGDSAVDFEIIMGDAKDPSLPATGDIPSSGEATQKPLPDIPQSPSSVCSQQSTDSLLRANKSDTCESDSKSSCPPSPSTVLSFAGIRSTPDLDQSNQVDTPDSSWEDDIDFAYEQEMEATCDNDWTDVRLQHKSRITPQSHHSSVYSNSTSNSSQIWSRSLHFGVDSRESIPLSAISSTTSLTERMLGSPSSSASTPRVVTSRVGHRGFAQARKNSLRCLKREYNASAPAVEPKSLGTVLQPDVCPFPVDFRCASSQSFHHTRRQTDRTTAEPRRLSYNATRTRDPRDEDRSSCSMTATKETQTKPQPLTWSIWPRPCSSRPQSPDSTAAIAAAATTTPSVASRRPISPPSTLPDLSMFPRPNSPSLFIRRPETPEERAVMRAAGAAARHYPRRTPTPTSQAHAVTAATATANISTVTPTVPVTTISPSRTPPPLSFGWRPNPPPHSPLRPCPEDGWV